MIGDGWAQPEGERFERRMPEMSRLVVKPAPNSARTERGTPLSWHFAVYGPTGSVIKGFSRTELFNSETYAMSAAVAYYLRRVLSA